MDLLMRIGLLIAILVAAIWFWFGSAFAADKELTLPDSEEIGELLQYAIISPVQSPTKCDEYPETIFIPRRENRMFLILPTGEEKELNMALFSELTETAKFKDLDEKILVYKEDEICSKGFWIAFRSLDGKGVKFKIE